jgi:geranylgeranyl diphosphate synthase, type II
MYGDRYEVAPLSVLLDPDRALRVLGVEPGRSFSPKVLYVYLKQLEEADVIVMNKVDAVAPRRIAALRAALEAVTVAMIRAAAEGHRTLALGQGAELSWARNPKPLSSLQVLDIFRQKTAPAFDVALAVGTLYAGTSEDVSGALGRYSEALGIAYQIRDDIEDLAGSGGDVCGGRPSLPLAVGHERGRAHDEHAAVLAPAWRREAACDEARAAVLGALAALNVHDRCDALLQGYKEQAIRALVDIDTRA